MGIFKNIFMLLLLFVSAQAQLQTKIIISSYYDDNLFRSPQPESDLYSNLGIKLKYKAQDSNFSIHDEINYLTFTNNNQRNFYLNNLGVDYFTPLGKDKDHTFYTGAEWTMRMDNQEYNYYDYQQFYAYANWRFNLNPFFLKTGYNFRYRSYTYLPDLTNSRHYIFLQLNRAFQTGTTFILEGDAGYKTFTGSDFYLRSSGGKRGFGRWMEDDGAYSYSTIPDMAQGVLLARVAQSLHPRVGIYFQYRRQISLKEQSGYLNNESYFQDEELFDDPFSYESTGYNSQLTWMSPWGIKLQFGGNLNTKDYISESAFLSAEDSVGLGGIRKDDQQIYYITLSKTIFIKKQWLNSLKLNLNYNYIRNESNSYWYDYKNATIGGSVQWHF